MKAIRYTIETINPIIISDSGSDQNMLNTKTYINGNSILGLLACKYVKKHDLANKARKDNTFYKLFLQGDLIFSNAYITRDHDTYYPSPISIKKEKYKNDIFDLLFVGKDFDKSTESISEYLRIFDSTISTETVKKQIAFHHARNRNTGTAKPGKIFNYESISPGQKFIGRIIGEENDLEIIKKEFSNNFTGYLGRSRNSEYGKMKIIFEDIADYDQEIAIEENMEHDKVVMTLLSDTIIYNENGFSTIDTDKLQEVLGVSITNSYINKVREEKYVGIWKCKNQSENCFKAGSSFLLEKLPENYQQLQKNGIGERTHEGFGRVIFGYQKFLNSDDNYSIISYNKEIARPTGNPPEIVKKIASQILKDKMIDLTREKAMRDAGRFKDIPTNSLLGKLTLLSKDINSFSDNLSKLRDPARDKLKKCRNHSNKLMDYLKKNSFIEDKDYIGIKPLKNLKTEVGIAINDLISDELNQLYLETFFKSLKWKKKQKEQEEQKEARNEH